VILFFIMDIIALTPEAAFVGNAIANGLDTKRVGFETFCVRSLYPKLFFRPVYK